jgi:hypothetical protein
LPIQPPPPSRQLSSSTCWPKLLVIKAKWAKRDRWGDDLDKVKGDHCLVSWKNCISPKKWGGHGIKYLDNLGRALRLRSLWHSWDTQVMEKLAKVPWQDWQGPFLCFDTNFSWKWGKQPPFVKQNGCKVHLRWTWPQICMHKQDIEV